MEGPKRSRVSGSVERPNDAQNATSMKASIETLVYTKKALWQSLQEASTSSKYLVKVEERLRHHLNMAFQQQVSTPIMVMGPPGCGSKALVNRVIASYSKSPDPSSPSAKTSHSFRISNVGRINGLVVGKDKEALASLADQFLVRSSTEDRHHNLALEDLKEHFIQCRLSKCPAVIILEEVEQFAVRDKQTLLYTLLDLMQDNRYLFLVVGITHCAKLQLEKRVISRLSAQYVFIPSPSGRQVCDILYDRLAEPLLKLDAKTSSASASNTSSTSNHHKPYDSPLPSASSHLSSSSSSSSSHRKRNISDTQQSYEEDEGLSEEQRTARSRHLQDASRTFTLHEYYSEFIKRLGGLFGDSVSTSNGVEEGKDKGVGGNIIFQGDGRI